MSSIKLLAFLLVLAAAVTASAQNVKPMNVSGPVAYAPDRFIVRFNPGAPGQAVAALHAQNGTRVKRHLPHGMQLIQVPAGKSVEDLVKRFANNPNVEFAHPDYIAYASMVPNDPVYSYQWHFANIKMEAAWDIETGDPNVIVAVLDTGLNTGGYDTPINLVPGYDFAYGDSDTIDLQGHGTHVSGTIAQRTNNGAGVAGVAFGVSIMPVKVLDDSGSGSTSDIIEGLDFAVANGAQVISMSLGYPPGSDPGEALQTAITAAYDAGVVMVAASGNDSTTDVVGHPAAYSEVIAVGATDFNDVVSYYSNQGPGLEIVAPGGDTTVDANGDGYGDGVLQETFGSCHPRKGCEFGYYFYQGTSMATPHVSAVVGLLLSNGAGDGLSGSTKVEAIRQILHTTSVDLGTSGWDSVYGYGLVDARAALEAVGPVQPECTTAADCDDGVACTDDACTNGQCSNSANNALCDDGVACTDDACDSQTGCSNVPNDSLCDNGLFCDGGETCDPFAGCQPGSFPCSSGQMCDESSGCYDPCLSNADCYDGDDCTSDVCDPGTGLCSNPAVTVCDLYTSDGCCPEGCTPETDVDCVVMEICGDGFCAGAQLGEDCTTCPADCSCRGPNCSKACCGDYTCSPSENANNCPVDCQ